MPSSYWLTFKNIRPPLIPSNTAIKVAPNSALTKREWKRWGDPRNPESSCTSWSGWEKPVYLSLAHIQPVTALRFHSLCAQQSERRPRTVGPLIDTTFCLYLDQNQKFPNVPYVTHANSECAGCWINFPGTWYQHIYTVLLYRFWGQTRLLLKRHRRTFQGLFRG